MKEKTTDNENRKDPKEKINLLKLNTVTTRVVYWVFQIFILGTMIASIVQACVMDSQIKRNTQVTHIILCAVALVLYNIPSFMQKQFKLYVPSVLHIFILVFIFAHFVLGEVVGVYTHSAVFDKILHATSGLAIALSGFSLINLLNDKPNAHLKLNPFFVAFFSFCFALAIALLWEIFEFAADSLFGMNMQRWDPPDEIKKAVAEGAMKVPKQGYGLLDTMQDVIVSTAAALLVSVVGYIILKRKKELLNRFLLRKISDYETAIAEAEEAGDKKLAQALKKAKADALMEISQNHMHEIVQDENVRSEHAVDHQENSEDGEPGTENEITEETEIDATEKSIESEEEIFASEEQSDDAQTDSQS